MTADADFDVTVEFDEQHLWRMRMLEGECGLEHFTAFRLSAAGADWHEVKHLLDLGCPPETILDLILD